MSPGSLHRYAMHRFACGNVHNGVAPEPGFRAKQMLQSARPRMGRQIQGFRCPLNSAEACNLIAAVVHGLQRSGLPDGEFFTSSVRRSRSSCQAVHHLLKYLKIRSSTDMLSSLRFSASSAAARLNAAITGSSSSGSGVLLCSSHDYDHSYPAMVKAEAIIPYALTSMREKGMAQKQENIPQLAGPSQRLLS
jgi:hypothetical protein